jgi:hypothetical protein
MQLCAARCSRSKALDFIYDQYILVDESYCYRFNSLRILLLSIQWDLCQINKLEEFSTWRERAAAEFDEKNRNCRFFQNGHIPA